MNKAQDAGQMTWDRQKQCLNQDPKLDFLQHCLQEINGSLSAIFLYIWLYFYRTYITIDQDKLTGVRYFPGFTTAYNKTILGVQTGVEQEFEQDYKRYHLLQEI